MIVQWSGPLPNWTDKWLANTQRITDAGHGWHFLLDHDIESITRRIETLGVTCPPLEGRKLCDFRPALGEMYATEIADLGAEFWGHTDLDCVYGPIWEYVTDELIADCDVFSNDRKESMCGPFSLYRTATASDVYRQGRRWQWVYEDRHHLGFDERGIWKKLQQSGLRIVREHWEDNEMMFEHFCSEKVYPDLSARGWPWVAAEREPAVA